MMFGENPGTDVTWKRIPKDSVGVELGVWKGNSSEKFLRNAKHLHLVDPWSPIPYQKSDEFGDYQGYLRRYSKLVGSTDPKEFQRYYEKIYKSVIERFKGRSVTIHRCTTEEFFKTFNEEIDWVYVDALHSYEGCLSDLRNSLNIIKVGGSIFGDDYKNKSKPGVTAAVDTFIRESGLTLDNFYLDQFEIKRDTKCIHQA